MDNIPWARPFFTGREEEYLLDAFRSTWISGGEYISRFEELFTGIHSIPNGITVSSGTAALQLSLLAFGLSPEDEVIIPGFSFAAASNMVTAAGGQPVYADIDERTWCLDPSAVVPLINEKTRGIIAVHTYGNVCDMHSLRDTAQKHGLFIIEDAAEAAFSKYNGSYAGSLSDAGCFSFHATKTITTGEGGFILSPDKEFTDRIRLMRDHGLRRIKHYWHDTRGYNFRLTNLQAAIGCAQLEYRDDIIMLKNAVYKAYHERLSGVRGIRFQHFENNVEPVVWTVALELDENAFIADRDSIMGRLTEKGIETRPGFYPYSSMPIYNAPALPVSLSVASKVICLPTFCAITDDEVSYICQSLKSLRR